MPPPPGARPTQGAAEALLAQRALVLIICNVFFTLSQCMQTEGVNLPEHRYKIGRDVKLRDVHLTQFNGTLMNSRSTVCHRTAKRQSTFCICTAGNSLT